MDRWIDVSMMCVCMHFICFVVCTFICACACACGVSATRMCVIYAEVCACLKNNSVSDSYSSLEISEKDSCSFHRESDMDTVSSSTARVDDEFDHLMDGVDLHDWNERFQVCMRCIHMALKSTTY